MKFINTLEGFDLREYYKQHPYNRDIRNYDLFTLLDSSGFNFTQNQFSVLFFNRRAGDSYLGCYKVFFRIYRSLKASSEDSYEETFNGHIKDIYNRQFINQFRDLFGDGVANVVKIEYPKQFSIKMTKLKDFGKEIYE